MNYRLLVATAWKPVFENDLDAFIPEVWAQESLMILENQMVIGNLVHRDFEDEIAQFGDVVNTRQPATFEAKRKTNADNVTIQNADATNVPVPLNQHFHVSFMIKDGEQSKSFKNLVDEYLYPAVLAIAEGIDQMLLGQAYRFRANSVGKLGTAPTKPTVVAARTAMNNQKIPMTGRNMVVTSNVEGDLLNISEFVNAEKVGDDGTALREGSIGRKFGMDFYMAQQTPSVPVGNTIDITLATSAILPVGTTAITVGADPTAIALAGTYLTIAGDDVPQRVVSSTTTPDVINILPGLKTGVASGAVVTVYAPGAVNQVVAPTGYAANYAKSIVVDAFTVAANPNQLISFGVAANEYAAMNTPTITGIELDLPLGLAIADGDAVNIGPAGEYCFGFHRNALAFVTRPLALPEAGTGARAFVASFNGLTIRVVITYNGEKQGHLVTVDLLAGTTVLNSNLGVVMYG